MCRVTVEDGSSIFVRSAQVLREALGCSICASIADNAPAEETALERSGARMNTGLMPSSGESMSNAEERRRIRYDGKVFRSVSNAPNGEVDAATVFHYRQDGDIVWATYRGGRVRFGTLLATVDSKDVLTDALSTYQCRRCLHDWRMPFGSRCAAGRTAAPRGRVALDDGRLVERPLGRGRGARF